MNVLLISIDSLRRDMLGAYADQPRVVDYSVATPNLDRFAQQATVFDTHYAGSMFCMPTRREWLAGVQEFPWRGWGPIEPFDTTLPLAARETGTFTQLLTDHYHYFQHGSSGYFEDFNAFEFVRGHEFDAWKAHPRTPDDRLLSQTGAEDAGGVDFMDRAQYARNVAEFDPDAEEEFFAPQVFSRAAEFVTDVAWEDWFCYVDSFDVHQPFHLPEPYASMYTDEDPRDPDLSFWPQWGTIEDGQGSISDRQLAFARSQFAGKVTMVDEWFGRLIDALDDRGLRDETAVVVTSDHGYALGDHGYIDKINMPMYDVLARVPLMIDHPDADPGRVNQLTAAVDLHPTILEFLDATDAGNHPHGRSLTDLVTGEPPGDHREWAIYGNWGSGVAVTDGRYTYHRPGDAEQPARCHSTSMMDARGIFLPQSPKSDAVAGTFLPYADVPVWRFEADAVRCHDRPMLYDTATDPGQTDDLAREDRETVDRMHDLLSEAVETLGAPDSFARRVGVEHA